MTGTDHGHPDLRAAVPTLEPDEAFLAQLSALAVGSAASGPPAGTSPGSGWRAFLAAASVAAVVGGGAWLAATLTNDTGTDPAPVPPVTRPVDPDQTTHDAGSSRPDDGASEAPGTQQSPDDGRTDGLVDPTSGEASGTVDHESAEQDDTHEQNGAPGEPPTPPSPALQGQGSPGHGGSPGHQRLENGDRGQDRRTDGPGGRPRAVGES